jgi:hypothetical protein
MHMNSHLDPPFQEERIAISLLRLTVGESFLSPDRDRHDEPLRPLAVLRGLVVQSPVALQQPCIAPDGRYIGRRSGVRRSGAKSSDKQRPCVVYQQVFHRKAGLHPASGAPLVTPSCCPLESMKTYVIRIVTAGWSGTAWIHSSSTC